MAQCNIVKLNLPAHFSGELPNPGEPVVSINGVPINSAISVVVRSCTADAIATRVTIEFEAAVGGEIARKDRLHETVVAQQKAQSRRS